MADKPAPGPPAQSSPDTKASVPDCPYRPRRNRSRLRSRSRSQCRSVNSVSDDTAGNGTADVDGASADAYAGDDDGDGDGYGAVNYGGKDDGIKIYDSDGDSTTVGIVTVEPPCPLDPIPPIHFFSSPTRPPGTMSS